MSRTLVSRVTHRTLVALLVAAAPAIAPAQATDANVVAGLQLRMNVPARPDTIVYQRTVTKQGKDSSTGTRTVVVQGTQARDGTPLLQVVQRFPAGMGVIVDTAIADARSFRAVAHRSHQPFKTMRFTFSRDAAEGEVTTIEGPSGSSGASGAPPESSDEAKVQPVSQPIGGPIFDSNVIEMVVAAMPLQRGFSTEAPFFIYERGGRIPMAVSVKDQTTVQFAAVGPREVWVVSVAVPGAPATVWVDTATHAVLRVRYDVAAAKMSFTDERATPLSR
ncbi:MAG TPA: hypothetical protein VF483_11045 [Gemmatimonadaceae bacterium]